MCVYIYIYTHTYTQIKELKYRDAQSDSVGTHIKDKWSMELKRHQLEFHCDPMDSVFLFLQFSFQKLHL